MSWKTVKAMQDLGQTLGNVVGTIKENRQAKADQASLRALQEIQGPDFGVPNTEQVAAKKDEADEAFTNVEKPWTEYISLQPKAPQQTAVLDQSNLTQADMVKAAEQRMKQDAGLEQKKTDFRTKNAPQISAMTEKEKISKAAQSRKGDANNMNRADWENYVKLYQSGEKIDKMGNGGSGYSQSQQMDDRSKWFDRINNTFILARANPESKAMYDLYLDAVEQYKQAGGNYKPVLAKDLAPLTKREEFLLLRAWEWVKGLGQP